jgi:hypothetical protein
MKITKKTDNLIRCFHLNLIHSEYWRWNFDLKWRNSCFFSLVLENKMCWF